MNNKELKIKDREEYITNKNNLLNKREEQILINEKKNENLNKILKNKEIGIKKKEKEINDKTKELNQKNNEFLNIK